MPNKGKYELSDVLRVFAMTMAVTMFPGPIIAAEKPSVVDVLENSQLSNVQHKEKHDRLKREYEIMKLERDTLELSKEIEKIKNTRATKVQDSSVTFVSQTPQPQLYGQELPIPEPPVVKAIFGYGGNYSADVVDQNGTVMTVKGGVTLASGWRVTKIDATGINVRRDHQNQRVGISR